MKQYNNNAQLLYRSAANPYAQTLVKHLHRAENDHCISTSM